MTSYWDRRVNVMFQHEAWCDESYESLGATRIGKHAHKSSSIWFILARF